MSTFLPTALLIFLMRTSDISLYTIRLLMVVRGRKFLAWVFGFCQSLLYINALRLIFTELGGWINIIGYATGFATGLVVGIFLEEYLGMGFLHIRIVSVNRGKEITEKLRNAGFAVTEIAANGRDGAVDLLHCGIHRCEKKHLEQIVSETDELAFITAEHIHPVQSGFWGAGRHGFHLGKQQ